MPSITFLVAIIGTQIIAMIICLLGSEFFEAAKVPWYWCFGILLESFLMFMILDIVKVYIFEVWSFELVAKLWPSKAHKNKLAKRVESRAARGRYEENLKKVRNVLLIVKVLRAFKKS